MDQINEIYKEIRRRRWLLVIFYASVGIVGLCALKIVLMIVIGMLALLSTTSALFFALVAITYVLYRGARAMWDEGPGGEK
ncbi:hypothetical protein N9241_02005 [bacterium]|nr:hypothetical protein [bacterium]